MHDSDPGRAVVDLDLPAVGHIQLPFTGGWPTMDELVDMAARISVHTSYCPECPAGLAEDFLTAMQDAAPLPALITWLRESGILREDAGAAAREPSEAERALGASYEKYAGQLAEIEALRSGRPGPGGGSRS